MTHKRNCCCCPSPPPHALPKCSTATRQNQQDQQKQKNMPQGSSLPSPSRLLLPPAAGSINYSSENFHILRSIQNKSGRQVAVSVSVSVAISVSVSVYPCCLLLLLLRLCLALLSFHAIRQLLTLPQMTAPKMAGCPFQWVN